MVISGGLKNEAGEAGECDTCPCDLAESSVVAETGGSTCEPLAVASQSRLDLSCRISAPIDIFNFGSSTRVEFALVTGRTDKVGVEREGYESMTRTSPWPEKLRN